MALVKSSTLLMSNIIYIIVLFAIAAFSALQVQGSSFYLQVVPVYQYPCIIDRFGETDSLADLEKIVFESPLDKVVDAFIDCPRQMCEVYYGSFETKSFEELDDLVKFVRDSEKINEFYSAIRSFTPVNCIDKSHKLGLDLYIASFLYDIPREYYLDDLKKSGRAYVLALLEKSRLCQTVESRNEISDMLNVLISKVFENKNSESSEDDKLVSYYLRLTINLMNNENVSMQEVESNTHWEIVLLVLSFNRFDLAEKAVQNSSPIDLYGAKEFLSTRAFKGIEDKERTIEILKKLLPNGTDRSAFNEFLNLRAAMN